MYIIVTYDLHKPRSKDYKTAEEILRQIGFEKLSPKKFLDLPNTTFIGKFRRAKADASNIRDLIWKEFIKAELNPKSILGGFLSDWAIKTKKYK